MTPPDPDGLNGSLTAQGFGTQIKAQGPLVILLLAIAGLAAITFQGLDRLLNFETQARALQVGEHHAIIEAQNNLACVLLMNLRERDAFAGDPSRACAYLTLRRENSYRGSP